MTSPPRTPATHDDAPEPFPLLSGSPSPRSIRRDINTHGPTTRSHQGSTASTLQGRLRSASKTFKESSIPVGFCVATGQIASSIPSIADIRGGSFDSEGWSGEGQVKERERRASLSRRRSSQTSGSASQRRSSINQHGAPSQYSPTENISHQVVPEAGEEQEQTIKSVVHSSQMPGANSHSGMVVIQEAEARLDKRSSDPGSSYDTNINPDAVTKTNTLAQTAPFDNGYQFPPKHTWTEATAIGLKAFWKFFITPIGFAVTIYGANVVAWGGMLFLLLCNASPAMCKPNCNDINSPRRIWIEIDSQILNALFCVTGFGTIPWRFRDLYYLMQYRIQKKEIGLRRLAGINRGWFRLKGSESLPVEQGPTEIGAAIGSIPESAVPFPIEKTPNPPLTGIRAPPTKLWKLDFVVWSMVWNTFFQAVLCGFMWGLNRYNRPSWSTGLFVALGCIIAACGGIASFIEGKHVKAIEGVSLSQKDLERLKQDKELGITHFNNINDEKPKDKGEKGLFEKKEKAAEWQTEENTLIDEVK